MVDTSLATFRVLELIALLFPVMALLLQLQHRALIVFLFDFPLEST